MALSSGKADVFSSSVEFLVDGITSTDYDPLSYYNGKLIGQQGMICLQDLAGSLHQWH